MLSSKVIGRDSVKQQHPHTQPGEKKYYSGSTGSVLDPVTQVGGGKQTLQRVNAILVPYFLSQLRD